MSRPPERDDLDQLLPLLIGFAQDRLQKVGEFYPFGCTMAADGQVSLTAADTGSEHPPSTEVIELLAAGMRAQAAAGGIRASGICYDIRLRTDDGKATDAIALSLEHSAGDRVLVVMPYSKGRFSGWKFGDLAAMAPPEARVFTEMPALG
jgi:hypothetical protein